MGHRRKKLRRVVMNWLESMGAQCTILLHVISDVAHYSSVNYPGIMGFDTFNNLDLYQPEVMIELKKAAKEYLDNTKIHLGDESIETVLIEGDFGNSIIDTANELALI